MKRRLFNILAAVSLVTLLTLLWSWIDLNFTVCRTSEGVAIYSFIHGLKSHPDVEMVAAAEKHILGFAYAWRGERWKVTVPYWFLMSLTAVLPGIWALSWRQTRKRRRGNCCLTCGYDLRASTDRCPECGTAIPPRPTAEKATS